MKLEVVGMKKRKNGDYDCTFEYDREVERKLAENLQVKSLTKTQIEKQILLALSKGIENHKPNIKDVKLPKNWGKIKPVDGVFQTKCLPKKILKKKHE